MKMEKNQIGVFNIDTSLEFNPNIDFRLEISSQNSGKVEFDFDRQLLFPPTRVENAKITRVRKHSESEIVRKFKGLLKNPYLISEVKSALNNSRALLNKTQYNHRKFSYIKYRKSKGIMGSLDPSNASLLSKPISRNYSSNIKTEILLRNFTEEIGNSDKGAWKNESRPVSANTVKRQKQATRPNTAKRPTTGRSLASTAPLHKEDFYHVKTFRESIMQTYKRKLM